MKLWAMSIVITWFKVYYASDIKTNDIILNSIVHIYTFDVWSP